MSVYEGKAPVDGYLVRWVVTGLGGVEVWPPHPVLKGQTIEVSVDCDEPCIGAVFAPNVQPKPERTTRYPVTFCRKGTAT